MEPQVEEASVKAAFFRRTESHSPAPGASQVHRGGADANDYLSSKSSVS
jgi:hypothetical protein